jgi:hypothetical protein
MASFLGHRCVCHVKREFRVRKAEVPPAGITDATIAASPCFPRATGDAHGESHGQSQHQHWGR